jgi:hypothetical protein
MKDLERLDLPSASSFDADVHCPGRRNLLNSIPDLKEVVDEDAERGIRIHDAWQTEDISKLQDGELEDYNLGLKHIKDVVALWTLENRLVRVEELPREERLWLHDGVTMQPTLSGRIDRWYRGWNAAGDLFLLVIDGKSGWATYVPPSQKAWQLRVYVVLAWKNNIGTNRIWAAFVKPKQKASPTDCTNYHETDLIQSHASIVQHLWLSSLPEAPRVPGPHCRYCPARAGHCPEAAAMSLLPSTVLKMDKPRRFKGEEAQEMVAHLSPQDLRRLWEYSSVINAIMDAVKTRIKKTMTDDDRKAIGLTLGKGRDLRNVFDAHAAFGHLWKQCNFNPDDLFKCLKFSNTALVALTAATLKMSPEEAAVWVWKQLEPWTNMDTAERPIRLLNK